MGRDAFDDQVSGIAALDHPMSARVYRLVLERGRVSRDLAAGVLGVPRAVAVFHLDKLVEAGLLETRYERLTGRTGPGAGRPAKIYQRSDREIDLTIPARRYELAGSMLADALARSVSDGISAGQALTLTAHATGEKIGTLASTQPAGRRAVLVEVLTRHGFEPREHDGQITLLNCPFHGLAEQHRALICGMNLEFVRGVLDGLADESFIARLVPEPGHCCVRLDPRR
jgi:predicted ArsR family transcriptional regulator